MRGGIWYPRHDCCDVGSSGDGLPLVTSRLTTVRLPAAPLRLIRSTHPNHISDEVKAYDTTIVWWIPAWYLQATKNSTEELSKIEQTRKSLFAMNDTELLGGRIAIDKYYLAADIDDILRT